MCVCVCVRVGVYIGWQEILAEWHVMSLFLICMYVYTLPGSCVCVRACVSLSLSLSLSLSVNKYKGIHRS
jgi:hypothetical protein